MTHKVASVKYYVSVFLALIALTATTVAVSKIELGEFNFIVAMTIAVVKGLLVVMFFMHLKQATSLTKLFAAAGIVWLTLMLVFIMSDYVSRGLLPLPKWMR